MLILLVLNSGKHSIVFHATEGIATKHWLREHDNRLWVTRLFFILSRRSVFCLASFISIYTFCANPWRSQFNEWIFLLVFFFENLNGRLLQSAYFLINFEIFHHQVAFQRRFCCLSGPWKYLGKKHFFSSICLWDRCNIDNWLPEATRSEVKDEVRKCFGASDSMSRIIKSHVILLEFRSVSNGFSVANLPLKISKVNRHY